MNQYLMAKIFHIIVASLGNSPLLLAICTSIRKILSHHPFGSELIGNFQNNSILEKNRKISPE